MGVAILSHGIINRVHDILEAGGAFDSLVIGRRQVAGISISFESLQGIVMHTFQSKR